MLRTGWALRMIAVMSAGAAAASAMGQSATRAVFVAHYFPVNSVSPVGATIAAFRIDDAGNATLVENEPSGEWTQSLALSPNGRFIASANGTAATVNEELRIYRVEADASLTPVLQTVTLDSPLDMTWVTDTVLAVTRTQQGGSFIRTYRWNPDTLTLTFADQEPSGYFNASVLRHPNGQWIYTEDSGIFGGTRGITQWNVAPDGTLTNLSQAFSIDPPLKPGISPDGKWMFAGTGAFGGGTVAGFSIDPTTGAPTELVDSPFFSAGDTPYRITVTRDNRFVYSGDTGDDTIRPYAINQETGTLTATGFSFDAGPRGSLGPISVLDDQFLIAVKDSNDPIGMWVFRINADTGELTQVGPLHSTGNRRPEQAMVTWAPPVQTCRADINGDGSVGVQDIFDFLVAYFAADPRADYNGVGGVTLQDIFDFLVGYFQGCP